jgi:hypothetical protein
MKTYRTRITLADPKKLVLTNLPFEPGQDVEVLIRTEPKKASLKALQMLLKQTQSLPQAQTITKEDIKAEIENYRDGR